MPFMQTATKSQKATVVHMTSVHRVFDARIFHKECRTLAEDGYGVVLIAPGELNGVHDRVRIRVVTKPRNRWQRMTKTLWDVYRAALTENAEVYHFHDPELIPIAMLLKLRGKRVIYDVHEDVPRQVLSKYWIPRGMRLLVAKNIEVIEAIAGRVFDGIVAVTPAIAKRFPENKTVIVQNFPIPDELKSAVLQPSAERPFVIAYVGAITAVRGIKEMVHAMAKLPGTLEARLALAGSFIPPELENEVREITGWERVDFLGYQSREGVAALLNRARMGLVLLHPCVNYLESYPVKLFEYMSAGIPVVASDFPLWHDLVEESRCGLWVDPLDPKAISRAIQWLLEHPEEAQAMGQRGRELVRTKYSWNTEALKLESLYEKLLGNPTIVSDQCAEPQSLRAD